MNGLGLRFYPAWPRGEYRVELDGEQIGRVRKRETRYNLRRVIVDRYWQAIELDSEDDDGRRIPGRVVASAPTRRAAGEKLAEIRRSPRVRIVRAERAILDQGYTIDYVSSCEDAETPGLLGQIRGVTDRSKRRVKIAVRPGISAEELADTLEHELHHVEDPTWDCGNRDVLGRGGPR